MIRAAAGLLLFLSLSVPPAFALNPDRLLHEEIQMVDSVLAKLAPVVEGKKGDGTLPKLTYEELYGPLSESEKGFLKELESLDPVSLGVATPFLGKPEGDFFLVKIDRQTVKKDSGIEYLETQYLSAKVYEAYRSMTDEMEREIGRRLFVASGYRSAAYQLYLFLFYLPQHEYSVRETASLNAFPGYSEHGFPDRQAIDFINEYGIDGEADAEAFVRLPEYEWLLKNANRFGFFLSYPEGNEYGIAFEPWHWHYEELEA